MGKARGKEERKLSAGKCSQEWGRRDEGKVGSEEGKERRPSVR